MKILNDIVKNSCLKNTDIIYLLIIIFLGIFIRIFFVFKIDNHPISDFYVYQEIATNIFSHKGHSYLGHPIAFQPSGYTLVLGYFYSLVGSNNILYGKILNVILASMTLIVILLILVKLLHNRFSIYLSCIVITFIPNYIAYNNVLGSEILITFLFSIIIYLQICTFNINIRYILIGIFVGVAALTKPFFLVYPVILVIIDWIRYKNIKNSLKLFFTSFIFLSLIIAPWAYRNYINFKLFIPVSYNGGYVLFINNNENNVSGAWMPLSSIDISENANTQFLKAGFNYRASNSNDENQVLLNPKLESIFKTEAIKWILNHPQKFFYLGIIRIHNTFFNGAGDVYEWAIDNKSVSKISTFLNTNFLHKLLNKYIYILSFCGFIYVALNFKNIIISLFKNQYKINYKISIPFFNILFFILISFVFEGQPRYNFPVLFLFSICMINYMEKILKLIKRLSSTYATKPMLK